MRRAVSTSISISIMTRNGSLYAVLDKVAGFYIGPIIVVRHEAAAIRNFGDIAVMQDSVVRLHPEDFELVRLGHLDDDNRLVADHAVILTGDQWLAAQQQSVSGGDR